MSKENEILFDVGLIFHKALLMLKDEEIPAMQVMSWVDQMLHMIKKHSPSFDKKDYDKVMDKLTKARKNKSDEGLFIESVNELRKVLTDIETDQNNHTYYS